MKLCKDCKWYRKVKFVIGGHDVSRPCLDECANSTRVIYDATTYSIDGLIEIEYRRCIDERRSPHWYAWLTGECGESGRFWEAKQ